MVADILMLPYQRRPLVAEEAKVIVGGCFDGVWTDVGQLRSSQCRDQDDRYDSFSRRPLLESSLQNARKCLFFRVTTFLKSIMRKRAAISLN